MKRLILFFTIPAVLLIMFSFEVEAQNTDSDKSQKKVEITIRKSVDGVIQSDTTIVYNSPTDSQNFVWHGKGNAHLDIFSLFGDSAFHRKPGDFKIFGFHDFSESGDSLKLDSLQSQLNRVVHKVRKLDGWGPDARSAVHIMRRNNENIIDLSDSDIISYKKKKRSGGREKIVILRKEKTEEEKNAANTDVFHYQIDSESPFPAELNRPKPVRELNFSKPDVKP